jgi:hypothetical protein
MLSVCVRKGWEGHGYIDSAYRIVSHLLISAKALNAAHFSIAELSQGFVGAEHFDCMVRLLGYGGLAMCMDEMLKLVQHEVGSLVVLYLFTIFYSLTHFHFDFHHLASSRSRYSILVFFF